MLRLIRRNKGQPVQEINMTAMCDVVFQLLIYLILTAKPMLVATELEISRPQAQPDTPPSPIPMVEIMIFKDDYTLCGKRVTTNGLEKTLHHLAGMDKSQTVIVKCAPDSAHEKLIDVLDLCSSAKLPNVSVLSM